jgi:hypothetical protein
MTNSIFLVKICSITIPELAKTHLPLEFSRGDDIHALHIARKTVGGHCLQTSVPLIHTLKMT